MITRHLKSLKTKTLEELKAVKESQRSSAEQILAADLWLMALSTGSESTRLSVARTILERIEGKVQPDKTQPAGDEKDKFRDLFKQAFAVQDGLIAPEENDISAGENGGRSRHVATDAIDDAISAI